LLRAFVTSTCCSLGIYEKEANPDAGFVTSTCCSFGIYEKEANPDAVSVPRGTVIWDGVGDAFVVPNAGSKLIVAGDAMTKLAGDPAAVSSSASIV
jgi:hypothetical protein